MGKLHIRRIGSNRWQVWVVPEDGYEGFFDSFFTEHCTAKGCGGWHYANDHNGVTFKRQWQMVEYLLRNF